MAKTYTEACPDANVLILDSARSIGGVWAKERLYPGLKTNNLLGSYEFSDFPMSPDRFKAQRGHHIPGTVVHDYLTQFADHFNLSSRTRLETRVESAELKGNGKWLLKVSSLVAESRIATTYSIVAGKLVIATGLTSEPFVPEYPGQADFQGNFFHSLQLKARARDIETAKDVIVLGGNKSAWDACYSAAIAGARVQMVMRPSGGGPSWVWPVFFTPWQFSIQRLATTRFFTWFDPCIWADIGGFSWVRYLLHRTWLGKRVVTLFWKGLANIVCKANGYNDHPEMHKLKPWVTPFWMGNSLGIHNYESNWFDLVREGRISIHIADVVYLSGSTVHLSNGSALKADTFICCTGWKVVPPIKFLTAETALDLGLPAESTKNDIFMQKADYQILANISSLREGPKRTLPISRDPILVDPKRCHKSSSPYQLYRFVVPYEKRFLEHRNIAFIGAHLAINAVMVAQAQALWITAFFRGEIQHLKPANINYEAVRYETVLHSQYEKIRHPPEAGGCGTRCPDLVFDGLSYIDLLLNDLGMKIFRKHTQWEEIFHRYMPIDYQGLVREWIELLG